MSEDLQTWVGRSWGMTDVVTDRLIRSFRATLSPHLAETGEEIPLGLHWCLAPDILDQADLGPDGHPAKGRLLPPVSLPRRMWASGELEFIAPLKTADAIERRSRIASIEAKEGRSGPLCFVTVNHEIMSPRGLSLRETQSIVYRDDAKAVSEKPARAVAEEPAEAMREVAVDPVLLFRYSALTFNGHRIHYDARYVTDVEGYPGLVVHGPLQATLLLNFAASAFGGGLRKFSFRGLAAASDIAKLTLNIRRSSATSAALWTCDPTGRVAMKAAAEWR